VVREKKEPLPVTAAAFLKTGGERASNFRLMDFARIVLYDTS
jgi:hypothetical protein